MYKNEEEGADEFCRVIGTTRAANSRNVSLLFLSCTNPTDLARRMNSNPLLARAINKSYVVQSGKITEGNLETREGCNDFADILFDAISSPVAHDNDDDGDDGECDNNSMILRMQVFPPKHQSTLLRSLDRIIHDDGENDASNAKSRSRNLSISPTGFTHMLSVVEVYRDKGRDWERRRLDPNSKRYVFGISPASLDLDVVDTNNIIAEDGGADGNVNRAYYKLKEAVEMYERRRGELHRDLYESIALDCGSAPGGWTKYLIEHFHCKTVYSVDPGMLSPSVSKLRETHHMRMKILDAFPLLRNDEDANGRIKIWVSDMCLHDMGEQADLLLLAKKEGLLARNALFVLTLKCVVGHSKSAYDAQVGEVVDEFRASANVEGVEIFHLFSNRSGERTVMGYIN